MSSGSIENQRVSAVDAGFDLFHSSCQSITPTGTISGYTRDLLGWLERSGEHGTILECCMIAARGLAHPNKDGMTLSRSKGSIAVRLSIQSGTRLAYRERARCLLHGFNNC